MKKIEQDLGEAKSSVKEKEQYFGICVAEVSSLEKSIHDHAGSREKKLKDLEKRIKAIKVQIQSASNALKVCL